MTIKELIQCGEWEEFFLTSSGEKLPKNGENKYSVVAVKLKDKGILE